MSVSNSSSSCNIPSSILELANSFAKGCDDATKARVARALEIVRQGKLVPSRKNDGSYFVQGSESAPYHVQAKKCTCKDFEKRKAVCKHRYARRIQLKINELSFADTKPALKAVQKTRAIEKYQKSLEALCCEAEARSHRSAVEYLKEINRRFALQNFKATDAVRAISPKFFTTR